MGGREFHYRVFGLRIASEVELAELQPSEDDASPPDVVVRVASVPDALEGAVDSGVLFETAPGRLRLDVPGVARFLVSDGSEVRVQPEGGVVDKATRLFLYGSALGAVLQQRRVLTLHASAITNGESVLAFAGRSGHGKSTLAAAFAAQGHALVSDDIVAVRQAPSAAPIVAPGYPWTKLWADARAGLAVEDVGLERVREELDKAYVPARGVPADSQLPVHMVFVLHPHNSEEFELRTVEGMGKITLLHRNTYRHHFLEGLGGTRAHFESCVALAQSVEVVSVARPRWQFRVDELRHLVLERAGWAG